MKKPNQSLSSVRTRYPSRAFYLIYSQPTEPTFSVVVTQRNSSSFSLHSLRRGACNEFGKNADDIVFIMATHSFRLYRTQEQIFSVREPPCSIIHAQKMSTGAQLTKAPLNLEQPDNVAPGKSFSYPQVFLREIYFSSTK